MRVSFIPYVQGRNSYSDADGTKYGIAIHNTSNDASADNEAAYAQRRTDGVSSHFYVDGTKVIQSLDTTARAGHAGSSQGNQNAVAFEIRGVNAWTRQQWLDGVCWDLLGRVAAEVCRAYGISARRASVSEMQSNAKVRAFYSHDDMRRAWGGTDHTDPGGGFPWDRLFAAVNAALNPSTEGDDMELSDVVPFTATSGTGGRDRTLAQITADEAQRRAMDIGEKPLTTYPASAPYRQLLELPAAFAAARAGDEQRDAAALAAVNALAAMVQSGGGNVDTASIVAAVHAVGDDTHGQIVELQQQLAGVQARNLKLAQALAAAGVALDEADD